MTFVFSYVCIIHYTLYIVWLYLLLQEIKVTQDFLKVLNGGLATQMSLVLFVVLQAFVLGEL